MTKIQVRTYSHFSTKTFGSELGRIKGFNFSIIEKVPARQEGDLKQLLLISRAKESLMSTSSDSSG